MDEVTIFLHDLFIATTMILLTTIIHATGLDRIMAVVERHLDGIGAPTLQAHVRRIVLAICAILGIFALITVHIWLWAYAYRMIGVAEFATLEDAVYFSTTTFTTLGFGDIVLKDNWRVLSGIEAANGVVLLGWSTAFIFEVMTLLYPRRRR